MATKPGSRPSRARAPRREGRRTTLRVPTALEAELSRTAHDLGTSENEALVHLAQIGAGAAKRQRDLRRVIAKRRAAVSGSKQSGVEEFPSPQEMREAILVDRS
ncbi:MAG: hypothetical protein FVQ78_05945 [Solirubrobacterales bacterium]|nr:hypothetical protein [Solirubrobacterales bacterium]